MASRGGRLRPNWTADWATFAPQKIPAQAAGAAATRKVSPRAPIVLNGFYTGGFDPGADPHVVIVAIMSPPSAAPAGAPARPAAEQAEQLDRLVVRGAEPVRDAGVELGRLARGEHEVVLAEHQPQPAVEDVEPLVALVGLRLGVAACAAAGMIIL